jgi:ubiquinone/menaquinone biosynthesis C-methylase UbiE
MKAHWERVYATKSPEAVSWYAPHLDASLKYVRQTGVALDAHVIDIGGGESTLVDDLLDAGYARVSVLDISAKALEVCRARLGPHRTAHVSWLEADVLEHRFEPRSLDVWHDRAVFHFLTEAQQRRLYVAQVFRALKPGGFAIVGAFGPEGPNQCSGLPVARYSSDELHEQFGTSFRLLEHSINVHTTPWGSAQQFVYCFCRLEQ